MEGAPQDGFCDRHLEVRCPGAWPTAALAAQGGGLEGRARHAGALARGGLGAGGWSGVQERLHS